MELQSKIDFVSVITEGAINQMSSPVDEITVTQKGITVDGLQSFGKAMHWDTSMSTKVFRTTKRTLERHAKEHKPLSLNISENALDVARLATLGTGYFGNVERWNKWLTTPHIQFGNKPPQSVMYALRGREMIKRIIRGLEYGFTA